MFRPVLRIRQVERHALARPDRQKRTSNLGRQHKRSIVPELVSVVVQTAGLLIAIA
jgi:hypothetical protein